VGLALTAASVAVATIPLLAVVLVMSFAPTQTGPVASYSGWQFWAWLMIGAVSALGGSAVALLEGSIKQRLVKRFSFAADVPIAAVAVCFALVGALLVLAVLLIAGYPWGW
jgi:formate-dependent nitrite reductase membrane component NrfD